MVVPTTVLTPLTPTLPSSGAHSTFDDKTDTQSPGAFSVGSQDISQDASTLTASNIATAPILSSGTYSVSDGKTIIPNPGAFSVKSQGISQDISTITVSNTATAPILSSGGPSVSNDKTIIPSLGAFSVGSQGLPRGSSAIPTSNIATPIVLTSGGDLTIGDKTITPNPTAFTIGSQVLSQGGSAITISNTPLSLGPAGLIVDMTKTIQLDPALEFTIEGQGFTAAPTGFDIDGVTLLPGQPGLTIDGGKVVASLGSGGDGIVLVEGGSTTTIPLAQTTTIGLGGVIMSGFAPIDLPTKTPLVTSSSLAPNGSEIYFNGRGSRILAIKFSSWWQLLFVVICTVPILLYS